MGRAPCCEKTGLNKGPWTPEEDHLLVAHVQRYGHPNWRALPNQAGLLRCGKSCRLRWINYLRPDIKRGNFSKEEEDAIIRLHEMLGNRWSAIAAKLPGRTDNEIKNVWHTHLKKRGQPKQIIQTSNTKGGCKSNAPIVLQLNSTMEYPTYEASRVASPAWSGSIISFPGSDSSALTGDTDNSSEEFAELDDSFWSEALSMDDSVTTMDSTASESPLEAPISEPFSPFDSSDADMSFWLRVLAEAGGELHDMPVI